jgi:hypothetical protein
MAGAPDCRSGGCGFESRRACQSACSSMVEGHTLNVEVAGSSPAAPTIKEIDRGLD